MSQIESRVPDQEPFGSDSDARGLSTAALEQALVALRERLRQDNETINELRKRAEKATEEERLLRRLLALRRGEVSPSIEEDVSPSSMPPLNLPRGRRAVDEVVALLEAKGHPLHVSELMRVLRERDVEIPGSGTQANLISHMSRDARIVRPTRGMYGLAEWGLEAMQPTPKRARRRRVRRTAASPKEK